MNTIQSSILAFTILVITGYPGQSKPVAKALEVELPVDQYKVIFGGTEVGGMSVSRAAKALNIDFSYSNNGRGASSQETPVLSDNNLPVDWHITGKTTFGNSVDDKFSVQGNTANWKSTAESGTADFNNDAL